MMEVRSLAGSGSLDLSENPAIELFELSGLFGISFRPILPLLLQLGFRERLRLRRTSVEVFALEVVEGVDVVVHVGIIPCSQGVARAKMDFFEISYRCKCLWIKGLRRSARGALRIRNIRNLLPRNALDYTEDYLRFGKLFLDGFGV
mgnify:CR=1 FL=1